MNHLYFVNTMTGKANFGGHSPAGSGMGAIFSGFSHFKRILELNNRVLEKIGVMEQALGGEYVFDRAFLNSSVVELVGLVRKVIYHLNSLADHRYAMLYERFEAIAGHLAELAAGGPGPYASQLVLPYGTLNRDIEHLVGGKNAVLGEIRSRLPLVATPDGFALTIAAYRLFMEENDLFGKVAAVLAGPGPVEEQDQAIQLLFDRAMLPAPVVAAVSEQLTGLTQAGCRALAVRSSAVGEDGSRSFAGQFLSVLNVAPAGVLDACKKVMASRFSHRVRNYLGPDVEVGAVPMAVGVQAMVPTVAAGVVYSREPTAAGGELLTIAAIAGHGGPLVGGKAEADRFYLTRQYPFELFASHIAAKPVAEPLADHLRPLAPLTSGLGRGSATITLAALRSLAETAMLLEKFFEGPQDIEWAMDDGGHLVILQSRPLQLAGRPPVLAAAVAAELRDAPLLMENKGHVAQVGVAAGRIVHVETDTVPEDFPIGAVAVSRYASPRLSGIVRRAAAIITEIGSPAGHLASIAREYRTPAIFGAGEASRCLVDGLEVTVDAEARRVYAGMVQGLVALQAAREKPEADWPEMRLLRRLLHWIAPITLTDPESPDFAPGNCQTLHDILRFCHEKAVDTLINLHTGPGAINTAASRPLTTSIPIGIRLFDLGGGLWPTSDASAAVRVEDVRSRPLRALLAGLLREGAWDREPMALGLKDIMAGMTRPLAMLTHPEYGGLNLALVAENYCNLSLRLGYHFNVIDAYVSSNPDDNYIYFRFVGGLAEEKKRRRRVALIADILTGLNFKVEVKGDLLIAKARMLAPVHLDAILTRLGELVAFTRQLDVRLADDETVEEFFSRFLEQTRGDELSRGGQESG